MLTIKDLSAGYGKLVVLHSISLSIAPAQFTAILGPNGSGKSTLMKSVLGLTDIFSGSIQFKGVELVGIPTEFIGQHGIAYVPQRNNVFTAMTVRENLLLALRKLPRIESQRALDEVYHQFPILPKRQNQRAGQLSGGERQIVAIALAWLSRPQLMLLDEPTAGLSPLLVSEVLRTLKAFTSQEITVVIVEQNARSALQWCDYVYVLREGQLVFQGTAETCRADEEMVKSYLGVTIG
jgi:ABC-type branched-subunit amino acid transport system ATPase component